MNNEAIGMSKEASAWTIIRVLGLLLLGKAILLVCALVVQLATIYNIMTAASIAGVHPDDQATPQLWGPVFVLIGESAIIGFLAYYFLRRGAAIHKLLRHESPHAS